MKDTTRLNNRELPAFPISQEETYSLEEGVNIYYGLTKREYFAAKAMQGVMSSSTHGVPENTKRCAEIAVEWADELIKALEQ
jgi:hypothetical protein